MIQNDKSWYLSPDLLNVKNVPVEPQKHHFKYAVYLFPVQESIVLLYKFFLFLLLAFFTKTLDCAVREEENGPLLVVSVRQFPGQLQVNWP